MPTDSEIRQQIDELDEKVRELKGATDLILAFRLIEDGHAADLKAAMKRIRSDLPGIAKLYGVTLPSQRKQAARA